MKTIIFKNKEYPVKSSWNELSKDELLEICRIMLLPVSQNYQRLLILGFLTGISFKIMQAYAQEFSSAEVISITDYLFQPSKLTINHFPYIGSMQGPSPGLQEFTFEQFFNDSESHSLLAAKGNAESVDKLINCMYNYNGPESNFDTIKKLDEPTKLAIVLYYHGCSNFIKHKFKPVFDSGEKTAKTDGLEFVRLVNMLNQDDISKNEKIKRTNLYEALTFMLKMINKD